MINIGKDELLDTISEQFCNAGVPQQAFPDIKQTEEGYIVTFPAEHKLSPYITRLISELENKYSDYKFEYEFLSEYYEYDCGVYSTMFALYVKPIN